MSSATRDHDGRAAGRGCSPSPCSTTPRRDSYQRRRPDETLLYQLIEEHWPAFLERAEQAGGLPDFIVEEFEAYLRCGMLEHGVAPSLRLRAKTQLGLRSVEDALFGVVTFIQRVDSSLRLNVHFHCLVIVTTTPKTH